MKDVVKAVFKDLKNSDHIVVRDIKTIKESDFFLATTDGKQLFDILPIKEVMKQTKTTTDTLKLSMKIKTSHSLKELSTQEFLTKKKYKIIQEISEDAVCKFMYAKHLERKSYIMIKSVSKAQLAERKQEKNMVREIEALKRTRSGFVVSLIEILEDDKSFCLFLEPQPNGFLDIFMLSKLPHITESWVAFYVAGVALGLEHLHRAGFIYRSLCPETVTLDGRLYPKLADCSLCTPTGDLLDIEQNHAMFVRRPNYAAPEQLLMLSSAADPAVDWWTLGIFAFELLVGCPPFTDGVPGGGANCKKLYDHILHKPVSFVKTSSSKAFQDLVDALLEKNPHFRLGGGMKGFGGITEHAFFSEQDINWEDLESGRAASPGTGLQSSFRRPPPKAPSKARRRRITNTIGGSEAKITVSAPAVGSYGRY
uniref:Protein kinase domain-containing protein n=1 Tax=Lotharella globosa TaxID=91324 RepID=A0A7S3YXU1_9EUKA|mmetsp:Transcript_12690/g.25911  ORF Transcript_12690/g.25911 Transcript_12690/m.25911 type:complete len:424 (+) Transcript_12690:342-1613(+)